MAGRIVILSSGYDPERGKQVKDPYLGDIPSFGACRPDVRKAVQLGDRLFFISGKLRGGPPQYLMGAFEVKRKITALDAYHTYPERRLKKTDGALDGNIMVDELGHQHPLDTHSGLDRRVQNYIVGSNLIAPTSAEEIARCRQETLPILQDVFDSDGASPFKIIGRGCRKLDDRQSEMLTAWLRDITAHSALGRRAG